MAKRTPPPPKVCPVCGYDIPRNARACPKCGADHGSGWSEEAETYDGLDLPDEDFDYNQFVRKEFGSGKFKPTGMRTIWWVTAIVLIVIAVVAFILSL